MESEWRCTTLGDVCDAQGGAVQTGPFGSQLHASDYVTDGVPVVMPVNLVDGNISDVGIARITSEKRSTLQRHILKQGDIVFSRRGDVTRFALVSQREAGWICGTGCLKITLGESRLVAPEYMACLLALQESKDWLVQHAVGATMPNLNTSILSALPVRLPDIETQIRVTEVLGTLKDRIDNLRQTNVTLEAITQALFKSWFVDFDPVRAKAEGREPEGMDAATAALFPSDFEDSELGPIPGGWTAGTVGDITTLNASKWTSKKRPSKVRYVDLSGVTQNRIETCTEFDFDAAPSRARNQLREGDTIVGTVRPGNRAYAYIHEPEENLTGSTGFAVLSPNKPALSSFVYLASTSDEAIERLANLADGAAYPAVRPGVVADTPCTLPSDCVMEAFAQIATPVLEGIAKNNARAVALAALRDTLLPRLISGKLLLPDAEALLDEANA